MAEVKKSGGPFHRKAPDRRFVRQVFGLNRTPDYWTPQDLHNDECKLMEVKKFSAHYFDIDSRFRRPGLELISAYVIQNPFLWGQYLLRRDQMRMQLKSKAVREKELFTPVHFKTFEQVLRLNFDPLQQKDPLDGVQFFSEALSANNSAGDTENVKLMIMSKVLIGLSMLRQEEEAAAEPNKQRFISSKTCLPVDTLTNSKRTTFYKFNMTEVYPDILLVYRDKEIPTDTRPCKLPLLYVKRSYRTGTRFNPQENPHKVKDGEETSGEGEPLMEEALGIHRLEDIAVEDSSTIKRKKSSTASARRKISELFWKPERKLTRANDNV